MTGPSPYGQPDDPNRPQPGYSGPPTDRPQYGQPQYGQPQYGQPQYGQPPYGGQPDLGTPPAKPKRTRLLLTASAAVVVLAAGGVATYAAMSDSGSSGAGSPRSAVQSAVTDLNNSDLIGLLDDLAPPERTALAKPIQQTIDELKRNDVLSAGASGSKVAGLQISARNFTYAPDTITINDHVQIVQITGGTVSITGDAAKVPLSKDFLNAVVPGGLHDSQTQTVDIATQLRQSHEPAVRIATEKVGGTWYPSLFYTIADNATYDRGVPTAADAIPAVGSSSPSAAVSTLITDAVQGNLDGVIGTLSPDEMAVLHDYGRVIAPKSTFATPFGHLQISDLTYDTKDIGDGGTLVQTKSATIVMDGHTIRGERVGDCFSVTIEGRTKQTCPGAAGAASISNLLREALGRPLTARQTAAVNDVFSSLSQVGVVTSESSGKWYVDPVRTVTNLVPTLLSGLKNGDLLALISIGNG